MTNWAIHTTTDGDPMQTVVFTPEQVAAEARLRRQTPKRTADAMARENMDPEEGPLVVIGWDDEAAQKINEAA